VPVSCHRFLLRSQAGIHGIVTTPHFGAKNKCGG
jgi:hypothetical protein